MARSMHTDYPVVPTTDKPTRALPNYGRFFLHAGVATYMLSGFLALTGLAMDKHVQAQYGGFAQYLTIVGLFSTAAMFYITALNDLLPATRFLRPLKRTLLLFCLPVEIVIATIYWSLVAFKPELMFPPNPDLASSQEPSSVPSSDLLFRIPLWMDISMHAAPAIALLFEFFVLEPPYLPPASTLGATALAGLLGTGYSTWIEHCAKINGRFPYPFLTIMTFEQRIVMYAASTAMSLGAFMALNISHPGRLRAGVDRSKGKKSE